MLRFALAQALKTLLAEWLTKRAKNDLDDQLVAHLRDDLGKEKDEHHK